MWWFVEDTVVEDLKKQHILKSNNKQEKVSENALPPPPLLSLSLPQPCPLFSQDIKWKLHCLKKKAHPENEFLFTHLKSFLESETEVLSRTYFISHHQRMQVKIVYYNKEKKRAQGRKQSQGGSVGIAIEMWKQRVEPFERIILDREKKKKTNKKENNW